MRGLLTALIFATPVLLGVTCNPNLRDDFIAATAAQQSACVQLAIQAVEQGKRDAARTNMLGQLKNAVEETTRSNEDLAKQFEMWANELRAQKHAVCLPMTGDPTPTPNPFSRSYLRRRNELSD